ncbi:GntR family transcriptional regulator [Gymnodinialimonas sp. 2305UL16-5]|uniref:GntR family transcriptional regulator n=1 Tax=Gymnodinialimonas mytili TaxID=3126503 RepID=UPI0030AFFFDC
MLKQLPTVERLREALLADMTGRGLGAGDRVPSEGTLAKQFGVSRNTVREAMIQLESEGMVARCHGVGTILRRAPDTHVRSVALPEVIRSLGKTPGVEQIAVEENVNAPGVAKMLRCAPAEALIRTERVLTADGQPVAFVIDHLSQDRLKSWRIDWSQFDGNMIQILSDHTGSERFLQNSSVSATLADAKMAQRLKCDIGTALIDISTDLFTEKVEILAVTRLYILPNTVPIGIAGTIHAGKPA